MDKFTITFVAVIASVIISVGAVTVAASSGMLAPPAPVNTPGAVVDDSNEEIEKLKTRINRLSQQLKDSVPAAAGEGEAPASNDLSGQVSHLQTENAALARKVEALEAQIAELKNRPAAPARAPLTPEQASAVEGMAGTPTFDAEVARVIEQLRVQEETQRRQERRDQAKAAAEERIPRMVEFAAGRMELDETQQAMISEALVAFEQQRQDLEYQAWAEEWDRETLNTQTTALWESTAASLSSAGLSEDQVNGLSRMSRMGGGNAGGGRGGRDAGGFGFGGQGQGGQGAGGFGGRGGAGGGFGGRGGR